MVNLNNESQRLYNMPNHMCYGPARRCWVILQTLFPGQLYLQMDEHFRTYYNSLEWDDVLYAGLDELQEHEAIRETIRCVLQIYTPI